MESSMWRVAEFDRDTGKCKALGTWYSDRKVVVRIWREVKINNPNQVVIEHKVQSLDTHQYFMPH